MPRPSLRSPLAVAWLAFACLAALWLASAGSQIRFAHDVALTGSEITREVAPGQSASLTLHFAVAHALDTDEKIFVHCESIAGGVDAVHINRDADPGVPSTKWGAQTLDHEVQIPFDKNVRAGRYDVYAGLYDPKTGERLELIDPPTPDSRALVGWIDVVAGGGGGDSTRTLSPREMRFEATRAPWLGWLGGVALASLLASWALARGRAEAGPGEATAVGADTRGQGGSAAASQVAPYLIPVAPFVAGVLVVLEFIKDDAYISWRYAHNLVTGNGLVFNRGEHVEGFTNFLWVLVVAPFEALGWDVFQVCQVLGAALGIACLVVTSRMTRWLQSERGALWFVWGAVWLGTSSSFVLWAQAGLEQPLAALLPMTGAYLLWRARERGALRVAGDAKVVARHHLVAGLVMGAGCMTRPELHLLAILVGLPLVFDAIRARRVTRAQALYVAGILAVTVPCHAFRYAYYGSLIQNTFYVKTGGAGAVVWRVGLRTLRDMFLFNHAGLLVIAAPLAFASRKHWVEKATMAVIALAFMAY